MRTMVAVKKTNYDSRFTIHCFIRNPNAALSGLKLQTVICDHNNYMAIVRNPNAALSGLKLLIELSPNPAKL